MWSRSARQRQHSGATTGVSDMAGKLIQTREGAEIAIAETPWLLTPQGMTIVAMQSASGRGASAILTRAEVIQLRDALNEQLND